jgi:hypothetical protein
MIAVFVVVGFVGWAAGVLRLHRRLAEPAD